jgi:hypothetical protein
MKLHSLTTADHIVICKIYKFYLTSLFTEILISEKQDYANGTYQVLKLILLQLICPVVHMNTV